MKTSFAIYALLFVNTTALLSEPLSTIFDPINIWLLLSIEIFLVAAYFFNQVLKDINKAICPDFNVKFYGKKITKRPSKRPR
jgi:hypothetical protein